MFDDYESDYVNPLKRSRSEEMARDDQQVRPLARFVAELVDIYYVKSSRIQSEEERKNGLRIYDLEYLVPSISERVGSMTHHFQLIDERCVPVSFARSNVPLDPPKRPHIATILAVLVQAFVLESTGAYISLSTFDNWFGSATHIEGPSISRYWLDAREHVAKCFATKSGIIPFGQEVIWNQFNKICGISSLRDRIIWIIQKSVSSKHEWTHYHNVINSIMKSSEENNNNNNNKEVFSTSALNESFLWPLWSETFLSIDASKNSSVESKLITAESLFRRSVENCISIVSVLIETINGDIPGRISENHFLDYHILCSGTFSEFAAICLFLALKKSLNLYFLGEPTTRLTVELSAEVMSKLFDQLIRYYTFLSPSSRHYHLLDMCQSLWRGSSSAHQGQLDSQPFTARRRKRSPLVYREDVFSKPNSSVLFSFKGSSRRFSPSFSSCQLNSIFSEEKMGKLITSLRAQQEKRDITFKRSINMRKASFNDDNDNGGDIRIPSSLERPKESFALNCISYSWTVFELPDDDDEDTLLVEDFLRTKADSVVKKNVDKAIAESGESNAHYY
ncbi:uncharacterized protein TM35_000112660 [Trypanosoma theileri]|uniref:Uncharacterized protein n=1 Tax=Trypanosoma theileri TaxID=67003 RepID=A0A1X0NYH6_9TRYP|nr:uncharacterized protein TM35_000112660 [Trypanosoma theileri]ORC89732.1 hypothetical protein TM35_000112660 [Trypanosoma theileri]